MRAIPSTRQRVLSEPPLQERSDASLSFHIGCIRAHELADAPHPLVLCARAASGQAAAPPSVARNVRRPMWLAM